MSDLLLNRRAVIKTAAIATTGSLLSSRLWAQDTTPTARPQTVTRIFQAALRQHRNSGELHCRTLDRLHLAAMEELSISRLMTHDEGQAKAAIEAGFKVVRPGHS